MLTLKLLLLLRYQVGYLGEASLDVEYISGVGVNRSTWVWSIRSFDLVEVPILSR